MEPLIPPIRLAQRLTNYLSKTRLTKCEKYCMEEKTISNWQAKEEKGWSGLGSSNKEQAQ